MKLLYRLFLIFPQGGPNGGGSSAFVSRMRPLVRIGIFWFLGWGIYGGVAFGQSGSLFRSSENRPPENASPLGVGPSGSLFGAPESRPPLRRDLVDFAHVPTPEPRTLKLNDIVIVTVDEKSHVLSEGEMDRRKKTSLQATLKDWIIFSPRSFGIKPDPQSAGEPKIDSEWENKYRAQADFEARDAMKFTIAARVVDIRPNGNLLIEGRRVIQHNEDTWEYFLLGVIRPEDIKPNNTVESEKVAELRLWKRESGHVRDGYRRGWLMEWLDHFQPF